MLLSILYLKGILFPIVTGQPYLNKGSACNAKVAYGSGQLSTMGESSGKLRRIEARQVREDEIGI